MWKCNKCNAEFDYISRYNRHINRSTDCSSKNTVCEYCKKTYANNFALRRHLIICPDKKDLEIKIRDEMIVKLQNKLDTKTDQTIDILTTICKNLSTRQVNINNNIIHGTVVKEPYLHIIPLGKIKTDTAINICVRNEKIAGKIIVKLGKGDVIGPVLLIFKALHMDKNRKDLQNIAYVNNKYVCFIDREGWVQRPWEFICNQISMEIEIVLRRCYDLMDYKSKRAERAVKALNEFFKIHLSEIHPLKKMAATIDIECNMNNHLIPGMYSIESSLDNSDTDS